MPTQTGPPLRLAQLVLQNWSNADQKAHDIAEKIARKKRKHPKVYELDSFRWTGQCPYAPNDVIVQITNEGNRRVYVSPPGNVLHITTRQTTRGLVSFVYLERPTYQSRRQLRNFAKHLGKGAISKLRRKGLVRDRQFANSVIKAWHSKRGR